MDAGSTPAGPQTLAPWVAYLRDVVDKSRRAWLEVMATDADTAFFVARQHDLCRNRRFVVDAVAPGRLADIETAGSEPAGGNHAQS